MDEFDEARVAPGDDPPTPVAPRLRQIADALQARTSLWLPEIQQLRALADELQSREAESDTIAQEALLAVLHSQVRNAQAGDDNIDCIRASWYREGAIVAARATLGGDHPFVKALKAIPNPLEV